MSLKRTATTVGTVFAAAFAASLVTGVAITLVVGTSGLTGVAVRMPWTIVGTPGDGADIASATVGGGAILVFVVVALLLTAVGLRRPGRAGR